MIVNRRALSRAFLVTVAAAFSMTALSTPSNAATTQKVVVDPEFIEIPGTTIGQPTSVTWTLKNQGDATTVRAAAEPLGSLLITPSSITQGQTQTHTTVVPRGATLAEFQAAPDINNQNADLDLTVFFNGRQVGADTGPNPTKEVAISDPRPGTYTFKVFAANVPAGTINSFSTDWYNHPKFGALSVPTGPMPLAAGATASLKGTVVAATGPGTGRLLVATANIFGPNGQRFDRGFLIMDKVSG